MHGACLSETVLLAVLASGRMGVMWGLRCISCESNLWIDGAGSQVRKRSSEELGVLSKMGAGFIGKCTEGAPAEVSLIIRLAPS